MNFETTDKNQVLIIEDDAEIREALAEALKFEGYQVESVKNGQEGIDYLYRSPPPSLILLDLMMPVMNGYQFLSIHESDPHLHKIPVVVLSADNTVEQKVKKLSVKDFLKKPVELDHLIDLIKQYCH